MTQALEIETYWEDIRPPKLEPVPSTPANTQWTAPVVKAISEMNEQSRMVLGQTASAVPMSLSASMVYPGGSYSVQSLYTASSQQYAPPRRALSSLDYEGYPMGESITEQRDQRQYWEGMRAPEPYRGYHGLLGRAERHRRERPSQGGLPVAFVLRNIPVLITGGYDHLGMSWRWVAQWHPYEAGTADLITVNQDVDLRMLLDGNRTDVLVRTLEQLIRGLMREVESRAMTQILEELRNTQP